MGEQVDTSLARQRPARSPEQRAKDRSQALALALALAFFCVDR